MDAVAMTLGTHDWPASTDKQITHRQLRVFRKSFLQPSWPYETYSL